MLVFGSLFARFHPSIEEVPLSPTKNQITPGKNRVLPSISAALPILSICANVPTQFIDLYERPYAADTYDGLDKDQYLFKGQVLQTRTWVYQMLVRQLESAREGENQLNAVLFQNNEKIHETARGDCALMALDQAINEDRRLSSPFTTMAVVTFICAFSKRGSLSILVIFSGNLRCL